MAMLSSPSPDDDDEDNEQRKPPTGNWRLYVDDDPYYALLGEVQEFKVFNEDDNTVNEDLLIRYCRRFFLEGLATKPKEIDII